MWLTTSERVTLTILGALLLLGLGVLLWQRRHPSLIIERASTPAQATSWDAALDRARGVDVNTADVAELERLPGVGPSLAARIVAYRTEHGRVERIDDLAQIPGMGAKMLEALREYVTVGE